MQYNHRAQPDLIVVGGGIAGLTAGLRAAELGLNVSILEKGREDRYPCNSRYSGGILHASYHDVQRPEEELRAIIEKSTKGTADPALVNTVARDGRRLLAWLRAKDVRFMRFSMAEAHRWGMAPPRPVAPGLEWRGRGPDVMLRTLTERFIGLGGTLALGTRALSLSMADGRCIGVETQEEDGTEQVRMADAVLLSDGGYQANFDFFRRYIGPAPEDVLQRGAATGGGDGLRMAMEVGAATTRLNRFYGHLHSRDALHNPKVWPYPELDSVAAAGIVVDAKGNRVVDEGLGGMAITNTLAGLDYPAGTTLICDDAIWEGAGRSARIPANPFLEKFGGTIYRAGSIDEIAKVTGISATGLRNTIVAYNAAFLDGALEKMQPARTASKAKPNLLDETALVAIPLCVGITYTMGGIVIDGDGRVMDTTGKPIPALFAAGATTAGLEGGGEQVGYVGGLIKAVFGLRAAEAVAGWKEA